MSDVRRPIEGWERPRRMDFTESHIFRMTHSLLAGHVMRAGLVWRLLHHALGSQSLLINASCDL